MIGHKQQCRCRWVTNDPLYIDYHDNEWGVPQYDELKLFEKICLEGQQAGLSWITILKKRTEYRHCFFDFDPNQIIKLTNSDIDRLLQNTRLIRNRLKLNAIIKNANAYLSMKQHGENFSTSVWAFVNGQTVINHYPEGTSIPTQTDISKKMSIWLRSKGFSFVGPTICYAFMQAMGLVNDHDDHCFKK